MQKAVQLKITLDQTEPKVWRKIQILEGASLRTLHYAIQDVFGWKGYHSYMFKIDGEEYSDPDLDCGEGWLDDSKYKIGTVVEKHPTFEFVYDFGDWWSHQINFEGLVDADMDEKYPVCIGGKFSAPPEDCGGPHGYEEFKEAMNNKKHPRHEELSNWFNNTNPRRRFSFEYIDIDTINLMIGRRQKPRSPAAPVKKILKKKTNLNIVR